MKISLAEDQHVIAGHFEKLSLQADVTLNLIPGYVVFIPGRRLSAVVVAGARSALSLPSANAEVLSLQGGGCNCHCRHTLTQTLPCSWCSVDPLRKTPAASPSRVRENASASSPRRVRENASSLSPPC